MSDFAPCLSDLFVREGSPGSSPGLTIEFGSCKSKMYCSLVKLLVGYMALTSRIEHKCCLIGNSYLAGFFDIFILLHIYQNCVCFSDFLPMRTLCDDCHKEFESH